MGNIFSRIHSVNHVSIVVFSSAAVISTISYLIIKKTYDPAPFTVKCADKWNKIVNKNGLPPGLNNHGNLCFVNATLQAVATIDSLKLAIIIPKESYSCTTFSLIPSLGTILSALSSPAYASNSSLSSSCILDALCGYGWVISTNQQQDAHEFLQILLSMIEEEIHSDRKTIKGLLVSRECELSANNLLSKSGLGIPANSRWISPFQGTLANLLICLQCGYQFPVNFQVFESVPLTCRSSPSNIDLFNNRTLENRLKEFTSKEAVGAVSCPQCVKRRGPNFRTSCVKRLLFAKLPKCLILHLPRTQVDSQGTPYKDSTHIRFPEVLDITDYCYVKVTQRKNKNMTTFNIPTNEEQELESGISSKCKSVKRQTLYHLQAVVVHCGDINDGHFVTYKRFKWKNKEEWLLISDQSVSTSSLQQCLNSNAYMLFYEKKKI